MNRLEKEKVLLLIRRALREDIGKGDITTEQIVAEDYIASGRILLKESAVLSGLEIVGWVFEELGEIQTKVLVEEGVWIDPEDNKPRAIISIKGDARTILMGERVALNFIARLSGISTFTKRFVDAVEGTGARILDTRKTTPTFRYLEKYAVRVGGGVNHRMGLYDEVLIKENHISIAGGIKEALSRVKGEIEVRNLQELKESIMSGATHLLLDNMSIKELRDAVAIAKDENVTFEVSGGVTLSNVREIAETGVDYISVGALTHSYQSIDISLIIE
ncbi:carboxylating nicotinate-nucleotide diphosphorylase [candidate division WOR-3 bacterium]|nr:carboxylating nicotinate-nucleotide diphosphorylase [candidate division WOR-3 bacterium]